jgi:four helix bundle protein
MATIHEFEDLEVWQKARQLSKVIYEKTIEGSFVKDYSLRDQINRSSGSIMDNIAEGFERDGRQEFIQFLSYSKGSSGETRSQLYRALDRGHITKEEFTDLSKQTKEIGKSLGGFIKYLKSSNIKGTKYKASEPESDYPDHDFKLEI